jgi:hypothetical protein
MLAIEPCDDRGARTCEACGEHRSGGHFRIRPLRGSGDRVVCSHCIRGLVEKAVAAAGNENPRNTKSPISAPLSLLLSVGGRTF